MSLNKTQIRVIKQQRFWHVLGRDLIWFLFGVPPIVTEDFLGFSKFLQKYREVPYFSLRSVLSSSLINHCIVPYTSSKNEPWTNRTLSCTSTACAVYRTPYITSYFCYSATCFDISVVTGLWNKYYIVKSVPALQLQGTLNFKLFYIRSENLLILYVYFLPYIRTFLSSY